MSVIKPEMYPDQNTLKKILNYVPDSGLFYWKQRTPEMFSSSKNPIRACNSFNTQQAGMVAGRTNPEKYRQIRIFNKEYSSHRLAYIYVHGYSPKCEIDHINLNKLDDRIINLREVSHSKNSHNHGLYSSNTSGVCGVFFDKRWRAVINVNQKKIYLGYHDSFQEAVFARYNAEKKYDVPGDGIDTSASLFLKSVGAL